MQVLFIIFIGIKYNILLGRHLVRFPLSRRSPRPSAQLFTAPRDLSPVNRRRNTIVTREKQLCTAAVLRCQAHKRADRHADKKQRLFNANVQLKIKKKHCVGGTLYNIFFCRLHKGNVG